MRRPSVRLVAPRVALLVAALVAPAMSLFAGPLTPPGPPAPTMKTTNEIEPRVDVLSLPGDENAVHIIAESGSYYLTGNIVATGAVDGIRIESNANVSIDLGGFVLDGDGRTGLSAIVLLGGGRVDVRNGIIRDWSLVGINVQNARTSAVREVHVDNCFEGILTGPASVVESCIANLNTTKGIQAGSDSVVARCVANANGDFGIGSAGNSVVTACVAANNSSDGITTLGSRVSIYGCTSANNGRHGIRLFSESTARDNQCTDNGAGAGTGNGIQVDGPDNRIEGNNVTGNDTGLNITVAGNFAARNTFSGNTTNIAETGVNAVAALVSPIDGFAALDAWANVAY